MNSRKWPLRAATAALAVLGAGCATQDGPPSKIDAPCDLEAWNAYLVAKPKRRVDFPGKLCDHQIPEAAGVTQRFDAKGTLVYQSFRYDAATVAGNEVAFNAAKAVAAQYLGTPLFIDCEIVFVNGKFLLEKSVELDGVTADVLVSPTGPDTGTLGGGGSPVYAWAPAQFSERILPYAAPDGADGAPPPASDFDAATAAAAVAISALGESVGDPHAALVQRVYLPAASTSVPTPVPAAASFAVPDGFARKELHCTFKTTAGNLYRVVAVPTASGWGAREAYRITTAGDVRYEHQATW